MTGKTRPRRRSPHGCIRVIGKAMMLKKHKILDETILRDLSSIKKKKREPKRGLASIMKE
jgi:hypothetical protein